MSGKVSKSVWKNKKQVITEKAVRVRIVERHVTYIRITEGHSALQ